MNDFEGRLRDALRSADDADAPDATGLAEAARGRARARRRTTLGAAAVAVVLAVVAVPVGLGVLGGSDTGRDPAGPASSASETPSDEPSAPPAASDGMRTETWRGLEVRVPSDWGYGTLATWCLNGRGAPGEPVVERPGGAVPAIGCTDPGTGYGVQFFDPAAYDPAYAPGELREIRDEPGPMPFPVGAWVGYWTGDDAAVIVVARTEAVARAVLDSARTVEGTDGNGCAVRLDDPGEVEDDGVSVCRYGAEGRLEQSERLSAEDGRAALAAIAAAPLRGGHEACSGTPDPGELVTIGTGGDLGTARIVWDSECAGDRGVFLSGAVRELTGEVMYWALSPGWSGGTSGSVPLPDSLRR